MTQNVAINLFFLHLEFPNHCSLANTEAYWFYKTYLFSVNEQITGFLISYCGCFAFTVSVNVSHLVILHFSFSYQKSIVFQARFYSLSQFMAHHCLLYGVVLIKLLYNFFCRSIASDMARGHQKFQSQQKNAKKQADIKKTKGHDQKAAAKAALVYTCSVCRVCAQAKTARRRTYELIIIIIYVRMN